MSKQLNLEAMDWIKEKNEMNAMKRQRDFDKYISIIFGLSILIILSIFIYSRTNSINEPGLTVSSNNTVNEPAESTVAPITDDDILYIICDATVSFDESGNPVFEVVAPNGEIVEVTTEMEDIPSDVEEVVIKCSSDIDANSFEVVGLR